MRDKIYKAKRTDRDEWVYGYYVCLNEKSHRIYTGYAETDCGHYYPDFYEVVPETIGQYTGLVDKKDGMVFEGDIVKISGDLAGVYVCVWEEYNFEYEFDNKEMSFGLCCVHSDDIEVIGNIHDSKLEDFQNGC